MSKRDLDALAPQQVYIVFGGNDIQVQPPKLSDVLLLSKYAGRLENITELSDEVIEETATQLEAILKRLIPELAHVTLTLSHVMELPLAILEAGQPAPLTTHDGKVITPDPKAE